MLVGAPWGAPLGCSEGARDARRVADRPERVSAAFDTSFREIDDPVERAARFLEQVRGLELAQFPAAAAQLEPARDEWTEFEIRLFIWAWARLDHAEALGGALRWEPDLRRTASYAAVRAWARENPAAAQVAVHAEVEHVPRALATNLMKALAHGWAESDHVDGALEFIDERFSAIGDRESLIETLANRMLKARGLAETFRWAERTAARYEPDDRALLSIVFRKVARNAVESDPEGTMTWLERFEGDDSYMARARRAGLVAWGRRDPAAALDWALARPPATPRLRGAIDTILFAWLDADESALRAWLEQEASAELDPVISKLAAKVASRDPADASLWVDLIREEAARKAATTRVAAHWYVADEDAAESWLEEQGVSLAQRGDVHQLAAEIREREPRRGRRRAVAGEHPREASVSDETQ